MDAVATATPSYLPTHKLVPTNYSLVIKRMRNFSHLHIVEIGYIFPIDLNTLLCVCTHKLILGYVA